MLKDYWKDSSVKNVKKLHTSVVQNASQYGIAQENAKWETGPLTNQPATR